MKGHTAAGQVVGFADLFVCLSHTYLSQQHSTQAGRTSCSFKFRGRVNFGSLAVFAPIKSLQKHIFLFPNDSFTLPSSSCKVWIIYTILPCEQLSCQQVILTLLILLKFPIIGHRHSNSAMEFSKHSSKKPEHPYWNWKERNVMR